MDGRKLVEYDTSSSFEGESVFNEKVVHEIPETDFQHAQTNVEENSEFINLRMFFPVKSILAF